jgi:hypothetical protein
MFQLANIGAHCYTMHLKMPILLSWPLEKKELNNLDFLKCAYISRAFNDEK